MPAHSGPSRASVLRDFPVATLRQVATRTYTNHHYTASQKCMNTKTQHFARSAVSYLQIAWGNWYVATNASNNPGAGAADGLETDCPTTCTIKAGVEYPVGSGNWTRFTWDAGAVSKAVVPGATVYTDLVKLAVPIPAGGQFEIRLFINNLTNVAGIPYLKDSSGATATNTLKMTGDSTRSSATMSAFADMSMGGDLSTIGAEFVGLVVPLLILGMSTKRAILITGDSIAMGYGDTNLTAGDTGSLARSIGPIHAYANHSISGDEAFINLTSNAKRVAMAQYFTDVVSNYGINDLKTPRTLQQCKDALAALPAAYGNKPFYQCTITPFTTGTFTSAAGQTVSAYESDRNSLNAWVLANTTGFTGGVLDVNSAVEDGGNPGKWKSSPSAYTIEGLHPTLVGLQAIVSAGVVVI